MKNEILIYIYFLLLISNECNKNKLNIEDEEAENLKFQKLKEEHEKLMTEKEANIVEKTSEQDEFIDYRASIFEKIIGRSDNKEQIIQLTKEDKTIKLVSKGESLISLQRTYPKSDHPKFFFDKTQYIVNISDLPISGKANLKPWSSTFWPTNNGGVSVRYGRNNKNTTGANWAVSVSRYRQPYEHRLYSKSRIFSQYVNYYYSAAEKYDLAVGDTSYTLTNFSKNEGGKWARQGKVPSWYGICHGWATASYMFDKPIKPVNILAADGITKITFLPDDIKGLASLFWANVKYTTRWIGAKCNYFQSNVRWNYDPSCRSINPASFIITLANRIGIQKKNLVLDPEADPEIWNQPVYSYTMRYYNVINNKFSSDPDISKINVSQLRSCRSAWCNKICASLSQSTKYVIGTFLNVVYTVESQLNHSNVTNPEKFKTGNWDSAIELDDSGNVIGGEWKYRIHPNFLWRADEDLPFEGVSDKSFTSFGGDSSELSKITNLAISASKKGQVLKAFIKYLVSKSA
jgi:hypothetical protein